MERLPEYFFEMIRDWVIGELARSGRSRQFLRALLRTRIGSVAQFNALPGASRAMWLEWLVAQELFRRQCVAGIVDPESLWFWASAEHEVDFVDAARRLYEMQLGRSGPLEFTWFPKAFPQAKLLVIGDNNFRSDAVRGLTVEQHLGR